MLANWVHASNLCIYFKYNDTATWKLMAQLKFNPDGSVYIHYIN